MKITKCDKCGKINDTAYGWGNSDRYIGAVKLYQYLGQEERPRIDYLDLCRECQGELDEFVNKFMEKDNED